MALVILAVAILAVVIGVRGQSAAAYQLLQGEFSGTNSFLPWFLAIAILGGLGYVKPVRPFSQAFIGLVLVALFLSKGSAFFSTINSAFTSATPTPTPSPGQAAGASAGSILGGLFNSTGGAAGVTNSSGGALSASANGSTVTTSTGVVIPPPNSTVNWGTSTSSLASEGISFQ